MPPRMTLPALHTGMALHHDKLGRGVVLDIDHKVVTIRFMDGKDRRILKDRLVYEPAQSLLPEGLAPVEGPEAEVFDQLASLEPFEVPEVREGHDEGTHPLTPTPEPLELPSGALMIVDPQRVASVESAKDWSEVFKDGSTHRMLGSGAALATRWHDETGALVALSLRVGDGAPERWVRPPEPELGSHETPAWVVADAQTLLSVDKGNGLNRPLKRALRPKKQSSFAFRLGRGRIKETDEGDPTLGFCCAFDEEPVDAYGLDAEGNLAVLLMYAHPYFVGGAEASA